MHFFFILLYFCILKEKKIFSVYCFYSILSTTWECAREVRDAFLPPFYFNKKIMNICIYIYIAFLFASIVVRSIFLVNVENVYKRALHN